MISGVLMELDKLFGNQITATNALLFLARYEEATVSEIAKVFKKFQKLRCIFH